MLDDRLEVVLGIVAVCEPSASSDTRAFLSTGPHLELQAAKTGLEEMVVLGVESLHVNTARVASQPRPL